MSNCVVKPLFRTPFQQHVIVDWDSHGGYKEKGTRDELMIRLISNLKRANDFTASFNKDVTKCDKWHLLWKQ